MWKWLQQIGLVGPGLPSSSEEETQAPSDSQRPTDVPAPAHEPTNEQSGDPEAFGETGRESPTAGRTNEQWIAAFRCRDRNVIATLRERLARGLVAALQRAASKRRVPPRTEALAEDAAREATRKILDDPEAFWSGEDSVEESREKTSTEREFTTWARKIAVHIAFAKLRRED